MMKLFKTTQSYKPMLTWMNKNQCYWDEWACTKAILDNHDKTLHWLNTHQVPTNMDTPHRFKLWLNQNGKPWQDWMYCLDAQEGNLEDMKWLYQNEFKPSEDTFAYAAAHGQLHIMEWLLSINCPFDENAMNNAIIFNKQNSIAWLLAH